jgi:hypothetical protein
MGLDMYLIVEKFYFLDSHKTTQSKINKLANPKGLDLGEIDTVRWEFMIWRKANAIHKWFVDNVQSGEDDCKTYYVNIEKLRSLYNDIKEVLTDHTQASYILPTSEGFFFGGTDYDEYYFKDLKRTKDRLKYLFDNEKKFENFGFYYGSSW